MGDKLANVLIVFMMVVIVGLGGMYYVKATGGASNNAIDNRANLTNQVQANVETISKNNNTVMINSEENKTGIDISTSDNLSADNQLGYKNNNRYYYNYLDTYSKVIYDAIVNNIDKLKTGTSRIEIDYDFTEVWNNSNGSDELNNYYEDAINAINLDVPDLFYVDLSKMCLTVEKSTGFFSTKYKLYIDSGEFENYYIDGFNSQEEVRFAIKRVESVKAQVINLSTGNDYSKLKKVHDWLIGYMSYESTSTQKATVYGSLVERKGVCESYARALKYILDDIGIENILVTGTGTNSNGQSEDHMWNYVKLSNKWYAVDATWDDPIVVGGGTLTEEAKHRYFLIGSAQFFKTHTERLTISPSKKVFPLPKLEVNNY